MESTRSSRAAAEPRERLTPEALAQILTTELALTPDVSLYVAFSGGMDSHVLLHATAALRATAPWRIGALHVDHGLQALSADWSQHCAAVCATLDVPYASERASVTGIGDHGLEDAARRARYAALARLLPADAVLLMAHHQDDQAETLLLQLMRGAGVPGLAAMPMMARFGDARLARPLLGFTRAALQRYAQQHELQWIEDASNGDARFARNFLRHEIVPALGRRWPNVIDAVARAARHQAEATALLDDLARQDLVTTSDPDGALLVSPILTLSAARQKNLLRYWIRTNSARVPSQAVLQQILTALRDCPASRHAAVRWAGAEVRRYRDRLLMRTVATAPPTDWEVTWDPADALSIPGADWHLRAEPAMGAGVSCSRIAGKVLQVRLRRGGERCLLRGHHHKVKKLLQEAGVPPWERARLPLLYIDGDLAAVGDRWVCEPYNARADEPGLVLVLERNG
jgi:tRNA(Ile)-lysidine synthase